MRDAFWKVLPVLNFGIACSALLFQTTVLYPWHLQIDHDFEKLKYEQENKLREFHSLKLQHLEKIEHMLEEMRRISGGDGTSSGTK